MYTLRKIALTTIILIAWLATAAPTFNNYRDEWNVYTGEPDYIYPYLQEQEDVDISGISDGDGLKWNAAGTNWVVETWLTETAGDSLYVEVAGDIMTGNLAWDDVTDTIAGIQNQNLLDKGATETITGAYTFEEDVVVGDGGDRDNSVVFYDTTTLQMEIGWDTSTNRWKIAGDNFTGATTDYVVINPSSTIAFLPDGANTEITLSGTTMTFADAYDMAFNATTGTNIGTANTQKLGLWGVTPVVQPTALTSALTQISHTGPSSPDYAIATPVDSGVGSAWGFSTQDEFETTMSVALNLQTRVDELETKLQAVGVIQ